MGEIVREELRSHAAPGEAEAGTDHRQRSSWATHEIDRIGEQRQQPQTEQHERNGEVARVVARARRAAYRRTRHAEHDREHRDVLASPGVLVEHPLAEEEQYEQSHRHRRLHDHERDKQQRENLQRPAEQREPCSRKPARPPEQVERKCRMEMLGVRCALGVHRLQRYP
jgi:hypothetical protein